MELLGEEWRWKVVGLSEVVRLAKLLLAAHFSDLLIYLIHFRSIICHINCTVVKGNISCLSSLVSFDL